MSPCSYRSKINSNTESGWALPLTSNTCWKQRRQCSHNQDSSGTDGGPDRKRHWSKEFSFPGSIASPTAIWAKERTGEASIPSTDFLSHQNLVPHMCLFSGDQGAKPELYCNTDTMPVLDFNINLLHGKCQNQIWHQCIKHDQGAKDCEKMLDRAGLDTVGRQSEPYRWRPCVVTWDDVECSKTVVVRKLWRTSALLRLAQIWHQ